MDITELIKWITKLFNEHNIHAFYVSTAWKKLREQVLREQNYECQICKSKGKYSRASTVHHIKHLKEYPSLALTKSNLMCVCNSCHNILHPEKMKFKFKKKKQLNEEQW
ncbi:HNH endonuclease [Clostridium botulinum]|uniref:HNH endonuclease n=1 Tax=Clostridium botulinum TaxID=1491 RepID=UPI000772F711|nr:HNH endonuclease signature motif containing protein [Clostridium botulinum]NFF80427.1 HNH endonuclease [Clostridium botulinum]NFH80826.1 HNH endonuclease [Clostridium botulinum]NFH83203.1 HNH endonuclease [Clostridium botulinum]NFI12068.1 HNH endonuclease [Clostridium botulinum]NFI15783.1 HNH endonuclease [Clostridium botulinum]